MTLVSNPNSAQSIGQHRQPAKTLKPGSACYGRQDIVASPPFPSFGRLALQSPLLLISRRPGPSAVLSNTLPTPFLEDCRILVRRPPQRVLFAFPDGFPLKTA